LTLFWESAENQFPFFLQKPQNIIDTKTIIKIRDKADIISIEKVYDRLERAPPITGPNIHPEQ
jgi:hypothetical protein